MRHGPDSSPIARRVARIETSPSTAAAALARQLRVAGRDILDLTVGEPDFDTPEHIKAAAIDAILRGETKYTPVNGTPTLRAAITRRFEDRIDAPVATDRIVVGGGAKQLIFLALTATLDPGSEVIVPAPYWVSYPDMVRVNDGEPVILPCSEEDGFRLNAERLASAIRPATRWLILNTPANPTGAVYTAPELARICDVLHENPHVSLLVDEIYDGICFQEPTPPHILSIAPGLAERTFVVNGVSKSYAMTGWRLGYGLGSTTLAAAINKLQSQSSSCPSSVSQAAAVAALEGDQSFVRDSLHTYRRRRDTALKMLDDVKLLSCIPPQGAFYLFVNCQRVIGRQTPDGTVLRSDNDFVAHLLNAYGVATITGSAYGASPYLRLSIATSEEVIEEACRRIAAACEQLT